MAGASAPATVTTAPIGFRSSPNPGWVPKAARAPREASFLKGGKRISSQRDLPGAPIDLLHVVSDDRPLLFAAIDLSTCGFRRRRRRTVGHRRARGRAGLGVGGRRYVTHARRPCRVGRLGLLRGLAGRRGARLVHGVIIQAIEYDTQHNCDGYSVHCDLGAAGGTQCDCLP
jgi:hypothetical protein